MKKAINVKSKYNVILCRVKYIFKKSIAPWTRNKSLSPSPTIELVEKGLSLSFLEYP